MSDPSDVDDTALGAGKTCFVISPIGSKFAPVGSQQRTVYEDSLQIWEDVFKPVAAQFGMSVVRADRIAQPGEIPEQIFTLLRDADVVIADLSDGNPNVMYELGLRHSVDKVTLQVGEYERLPFDVNTIRTIQFRRTEVGRIELRRELADMMRESLHGEGVQVSATRVLRASTPDALARTELALAVAAQEAQQDGEEEGWVPSGPGYTDILAEGEQAVAELSRVLNGATEVLNQIGGAYTEGTQEVARSDQSGKGFAGRLQTALRLAEKLNPLATQYEELSSEYVSLLNIQDTATRYLIESVASSERPIDDVRPLFEGIVELAESAMQSQAATIEFRQANRNTAKIAAALQPPVRRIDRAVLRFLHGVEIIDAWKNLIIQLPGWEDES